LIGSEPATKTSQVHQGELEDVRALYAKSLVSKTRWLVLERERARLEGEIGHVIAEHAKAEKAWRNRLQISAAQTAVLRKIQARSMTDESSEGLFGFCSCAVN
jgi:hypothetical protein